MKNVNRAMRKTVTHLKNQELREFELFYQMFGSLPEWNMENLFVNESFERKQCMENLCRSFSTSGVKHNRLSIAAHEAGHAITMTATYGYVAEVAIDVVGDPDGLIGWVKPAHEHKGESDYKVIKQYVSMPCKPEIIRDILIDAAGFVAETFTGKKTGSNHEKFLVYCECRYLDDLVDAEPLTNWIHYINWRIRIILNNETLFWRLADDLLEHSALTDPIKILLHNRVKKEPTELFF